MEDETGILQQRVEVAAVLRGGKQALERVRCQQNEQEQAAADKTEHAEHAGDHDFGQLAREQRDSHRPAGQHQHPEQQRTFVTAPDRCQPVNRWQQRVGVLGHIDNRKVVAVEGPAQADERGGDQQELNLSRRSGDGHPRGVTARGSSQRQDAKDECDQQREDECEMAEFRDHWMSVFCAFCA